MGRKYTQTDYINEMSVNKSQLYRHVHDRWKDTRRKHKQMYQENTKSNQSSVLNLGAQLKQKSMELTSHLTLSLA